MSSLAVQRPDSWDLPLLLHVVGAAVLVGGLALAAAGGALGWRAGAHADAIAYARLVFRSLLLVALPAWWLMRVGAEWIARREGWGDAPIEPTWLEIGRVTADGGLVLLLAAILLAGLAARRLESRGGERSALLRAATALAALVLGAYLLTTWAMTGKLG